MKEPYCSRFVSIHDGALKVGARCAQGFQAACWEHLSRDSWSRGGVALAGAAGGNWLAGKAALGEKVLWPEVSPEMAMLEQPANVMKESLAAQCRC